MHTQNKLNNNDTMNTLVHQNVRSRAGLTAAYRKAKPCDDLAHCGMQSERQQLNRMLSNFASSISRRGARTNDREPPLQAESTNPRASTMTATTSRGEFVDLYAEDDSIVEIIDLTQEEDDTGSSTTNEGIVSTTFAAEVENNLRGMERLQLLSDDVSVGTFDALDDDPFCGGVMDWEMLCDTFEDAPSIVVTRTPAMKSDAIPPLEDELDWDENILLEALHSVNSDNEPFIDAPEDRGPDIVTAHEFDWNEELVSLDDFNNELIVRVMDGAALVGIFDDEPSTVAAIPEEEASAVEASPLNDELWDDQLAFLGSCSESLIVPWEDGRSTVVLPSPNCAF